MDPTSTGFLTEILRAFQTIFANGFGVITPKAQAIIGTLAAVEIAIAALFWALKGENFSAPFLRKLLRIGFFAFLVASWPTLTKGVADGLSQIGALAGGGGGGAPLVNNPSAILDQAMVVIQPIEQEIKNLQNEGWMGAIASLAVVIQYTIAELAVFVAFFIMAITCLLTQIEFALVAVLGLIFVPWGISGHTSFLAEKAIGAVIAQGVKLMVLSFIIAVFQPIIANFMLSPAPPLWDTWLLAGSAFVMAIIAIHAPAVAGGLLSGSPSLTAGSAAGVAVGAAAAAAGVGVGAAVAGKAATAGAAKTIAAAGQVHGAASTALAAHKAAGGGGAGAALAKSLASNQQVRGAVAAGSMKVFSTKTGQAIASGVERAANTRAGKAVTGAVGKVAGAVDRGATVVGKVGGAGLREAGKIATKPVSDGVAAVKDQWNKGAAVGAAGASPQQQQRLDAAKSRFGGNAATAAKAATTAVKGLTSTQSGGSGSPTIRPEQDD